MCERRCVGNSACAENVLPCVLVGFIYPMLVCWFPPCCACLYDCTRPACITHYQHYLCKCIYKHDLVATVKLRFAQISVSWTKLGSPSSGSMCILRFFVYVISATYDTVSSPSCLAISSGSYIRSNLNIHVNILLLSRLLFLTTGQSSEPLKATAITYADSFVWGGGRE